MSRCPAPGCRTQIAASKAFCRPHWFELPKPLRDQIWAAYRARDRDESLRLIMEGARLLRDDRERCKSCDAPVKWVKTKAGKWMILDAEPTAHGVAVLDEQGRCVVLTPIEAVAIPAGTTRFAPHWVTCPHADEWRKR